MARFKIYLEYEGTRYSGWQIQKNARTVQGEIHNALVGILKHADFELYGSGRTDAGVHALYQVAHLEAETVLAPEILRMKLNDALPADINILEVEKTHARFHARHDAIARSYLYQISRRRTAFGKKYVWWIKDELNFSAMTRAAALFEGMQNFQSFTADDEEEKSMKVLVESIELKEAGGLILVRIVGSHFLWKMVRQLVGVLAEVGRGRLAVKDVERMLETKSDEAARLTAPPSGLFLERVYYKGDERLAVLEPMMTIERTFALRPARQPQQQEEAPRRREETPRPAHAAHFEPAKKFAEKKRKAFTGPKSFNKQKKAHTPGGFEAKTTHKTHGPGGFDTKTAPAPTYYKPGMKKKRRY